MKKITLLFSLLFCFSLNAQVLTEGFEGGIPAGWTQTQITGTTDWITAANNQNNSVQPRTGAEMAYFFVGNYVNRTRLETPALDLTTLTTPVLTFYYTNATWGGDIEELRVFVKNSAAGAWTQVAEYTANAETWTEVNIVLPDASNDYYIAFEAKANWGRGATLDDILVDELSGCLPVGSLATTATSTTEADLSWVAAGSESDWTYEYGLAGYTQGAGQIGGAAVTAQTASISGLTPGTDYDFYVQANCGGGDGDSMYAGPFTWTQSDVGQACGTALAATVDPDCTTPLSLDFSTGLEGGASCDTFNNTVLWVTTTAPASGGLEVSMSEVGDVAIFDACNGTEVACGAMPLVVDGLTPGSDYYLAVWKDEANSVAVNDLCIESYTAAPAPDCTETPIVPADDATDVSAFGTITLSWTAPSSGPAPTAYNIYSGTVSGALALFATVDAPATTFDTTVGAYSTEIFWSVVSVNDGVEAVGPCEEWSFVTEDAPPPPANDNACDAILLNVGDASTGGAYTNVSATVEAGELPGDCYFGTPSASETVWFSFVAPGSGEVLIATEDTGTGATLDDTQITLFTVADCSDLTTGVVQIACDEDDDADVVGDGVGLQANLQATGLTPGNTYYFIVDGFNTDTGTFDVALSDPTLSVVSFENEDAFTYYPNPVDNMLQLNAQKDIQNVTVFNMLGQEVLRVAPNAIESTVDMSEFSQGAYFVQVTIGDSTETVRIIKK